MNGREVVGGLAAYELDKFEQDRGEIYIYDLAVIERHRRIGVTGGLIGELRKRASERNVYIIFVQADTEGRPSNRVVRVVVRIKETAYHFDIEVSAHRYDPSASR